MKFKKMALIAIMLLVMLLSVISGVSAQDIDIDSMSGEELTTLLMEILNKLNQADDPAGTPEPVLTATPTPLPVNTPQTELSNETTELEALLLSIMQKLQGASADDPAAPAVGTPVPVSIASDEDQFSIWDNKKLIIEGLPSYMFIQPTKQQVPDNNDNDTPGSKATPTPFGNTRDDDYDDHNCLPGQQWVCDVYGRCYCTWAKG